MPKLPAGFKKLKYSFVLKTLLSWFLTLHYTSHFSGYSYSATLAGWLFSLYLNLKIEVPQHLNLSFFSSFSSLFHPFLWLQLPSTDKWFPKSTYQVYISPLSSRLMCKTFIFDISAWMSHKYIHINIPNIIHNFHFQACDTSKIPILSKQPFHQPRNLGTVYLLSPFPFSKLPDSVDSNFVPFPTFEPLSHGYPCIHSCHIPQRLVIQNAGMMKWFFNANVMTVRHSLITSVIPSIISQRPIKDILCSLQPLCLFKCWVLWINTKCYGNM